MKIVLYLWKRDTVAIYVVDIIDIIDCVQVMIFLALAISTKLMLGYLNMDISIKK